LNAVEGKDFVQHMKAVDDGTDFDKEKAIASIRKTEVHGEKDRQITCWPSVDELKAKND